MIAKDGTVIINPRRIPVEGIFLHYSIDDIVYGYLQASASYNPNTNLIYIKKRDMTGIKRMLKTVVGCSSASTVANKINRLLDEGLLAYDEKTELYTFPYNRDEKYKIVSSEMLFRLTTVYKPMVVKIFIYLLDKYEWKKSINDRYCFTISELSSMMGYAKSSRSQEEAIRAILENLRDVGYIDYEEGYTINEETGKPVPRMWLNRVSTDYPVIENENKQFQQHTFTF